MTTKEKILAHFAEQSAICGAFGSPFTGQLMAHMRDDIEAGGPTAKLLADWPTNPRADALALRLTGAAHAAALTNRDPQLAQLYPANNPNWRMDEIWPLVRALFERDYAWARAFIQSAPQTNEIRRSIALLAGFLHFAQDWRGPLDMLEIGASAGLNQNWDRFAYRPNGWSWGADSPVVVDTDWNGAPPPVAAPIDVRSRAACDLNPLDIGDEAQLLQLKSYVWPEHAIRFERIEAAVAAARAAPPDLVAMNAADFVERELARPQAEGTTRVLMHSIVMQYVPEDQRARIRQAMEAHGAKATAERPLAWIALEADRTLLNHGLRVRYWPDGEEQALLSASHAHGAWIEWLA